MGCHAGHAAGKDLAGLGREFLQEVGILVVDRLGGDVQPAAGHRAVRLAEVSAALWSLGCAHGRKGGIALLGLAVEGVALEVGIVLLFFKAARRAEALFVAGGDIPGDRLAFGNRFGAFEDDDVAWHGDGSL